MIEIRGVSKVYGSTTVVDDVTTTIPAGGMTSVIGANGAGKSTLLSMVARLLPMSAGSVTVEGLDVTTTPGDRIARRLAILRQDNHLAVRLTVRELVTFGRYPHSKGRLTTTDADAIGRAIDYLHLGPLANRYLDELSGGQRQRAFVAMVLAQETDYVLLDEPLNNLDMVHSAGMMQILRRTCDELGKTVVMVLHDINFASVYSDRIIAMRDGRIVAEGSPEEIITTEQMRLIYGLEIPVELVGGNRIGMYYTCQSTRERIESIGVS
ncbi:MULTISPECIES: ABC transporter ATP-binding protein [unclassified Pseudactinotalea]|uniref:iron ABC transporter ATP-binding protein n=1 Tax=unclassified Pseudactinotalea TaxID=2649176 RepID=UPI00128E90AB|nr:MULTISPECIES: ATP-binding cassette domain-containing protein [unclassified Pseudactinotalea]MPV49393.1 ATP-binding cassette domain-containing protein [Pseudactinotalea sp. HY160]QGH69315.1 ATP-binding cassette domain-containing protein [Pseudactinotalea sp. HY158]